MAAIWVVLYHYPLQHYGILDPILAPILNIGDRGVDLFFILSGFIISYVHQRHFAQFDWQETQRFFILRLARLYPVHGAMLFINLANAGLLYFFSGGRLFQQDMVHLPEQFVAALLMIHAWGLGITGGAWNGPSWSISAEWFAYLIFPVTTILFWTRSKSTPIFLLLLLIGIPLGIWAWGIHGLEDALFVNDITRVTVEFCLGVFVYNIFKQNTAPKQKWDKLGLGCILLAFGLFYVWPHRLLTVALFSTFIYCLSRSQGALKRFFELPVMIHLGELSYSIYLVHAMIFGWALLTIREIFIPLKLGLPWHIALFLVSVIVLMLFSEGVYHWIEVPARNAIRKWADQRFA